MKVKKLKSTPKFVPVKVKITLETKEEAQALYAMFNLVHNTHLIGQDNAHAIKKAVGDEFYISNCNELIANGMKYSDYYKTLR